MAQVRLTVLGAVTVSPTGGGAAVAVAGRRKRAVLATLLAARGAAVAADRLLDQVWGPSPGDSALNALHVAVSQLRALLEPDRPARSPSAVLTSSPAGYAVAAALVDVDAVRFERLVAEAGAALGAGRADRAAALAEQANALWLGPPYAECAAGDLVVAETARLEGLRLTGTEVLADARLRLGRAPEVVAALEPLCGTHPYRERLWQLWALALYRCDRQAEALAALRTVRSLLADELGVDPAPATRELEAAVLRQDPALAAAPAGPAPAGAGTRADAGRTPLVGRDTEFAQLRGLLAEAAHASRFALVEGDPGIGKTRLLEEAAAHAARAGARVVWGRCAEADLTPAYWPWMQVARALAPDAPPGAPVSVLLGTGAGPSDLSDERRFALFEALAGLLAATAAAAPLVLVLEDLHWADPASLEALAHLAVRLHDEPVALLASRREPDATGTDPASAAVAALSRRTGTRRLVLHGLAPAAAPSLVAAVLQHDVAVDVAAAVHERAEGNPFFMAETARLLETEQLLGDAAAVARAGMPAGVRDVVRRRLADLDAATRTVLEVAAVLGRASDLAVLAAGSDLSPDACLVALEPALDRRVLAPEPDVPGRYRFGHALVREVALADVPPSRRGRLHARLAEALLATGGDDDADAAAGHLWAAGGVAPPARAARALEAAASRALRRTAYESADELLDRALTLWRRAPARDRATDEAELTATLRLARLRRTRRGYGHATASVPLDRADDLARRTGRLDLLVGLLHLRWGALTTACDLPAAIAVATEMRELAERSPDPLVRLVGRTASGVQCWQLGRLDEAAATMAGVLELQESLDPVDRARLEEYGQSLTAPWALFVLELAGRLGDGEERFERLAGTLADPYARVVVAAFSALVGFCSGDPGRAARWAARGLADERDRGFSLLGSMCQVVSGWATACTGCPADGLAVLEEGLARFATTGARTMVALTAAMRVDALLASGRPPGDVRAVLERDAGLVLDSGEVMGLPYVELARARVTAAAGGDPAPHLGAAADLARRMPLPAVRRLLGDGAGLPHGRSRPRRPGPATVPRQARRPAPHDDPR